MSRPLSVAVTAGLLALALAPAAPAAAQQAEDAKLTVVHGVRGLVADVRMDGALVLSGFAPERVTEALAVPPGTHRVQAWRTGQPADTPPLVDQEITVQAGQDLTAGIGLDAGGVPRITLFDDDTLLPDSGSTALAVRGLAAADPVRVVAGDRTIATELNPGQQQVQQLPAGTYPVSVVPADGSDPAIPAQDVPVVAGRAVVLYLIGSQSDATLGWVAQTVLPNGAAPTRVDTGVGPLPEGEAAGLPAGLAVLPVGLLAVLALRRRSAA